MSVDEEFSAVYGQYFHEKDDENDDENYEESDDDEDEVCVSQAEFLSKDCCNNECHTLIPREMIESTRNNCLEMSKNELDLVLLSHIEAGIMSNEKLESVYAKLAGRKKYGQRQDTEVMRHTIQFTFYRVPVCRSFFLFVHTCTTKRYENLVRHFHAQGVTVRQHGLANKPSTHPKSFKPADIEKAVKFIESIADLMALPLPGRLPKFKDFRIMKLPSSESKSSIYRKYISSLSGDELKMSSCSFRRIWSKYIPHVVTVMKPADDLCDVCRVAITVALVLVTSVGAGEECSQEEFSKCVEPLEMLHLTSEFSIGAAKKEELDKLCHELRKGVRCIQSYTRRCMDLQQRNEFNKLYHGTNQFIRDLCNKGEFQDEYLKHAPCSKMAKKEFEVCANRYKETMVFLKPNKNQEIQENITLSENIKTICCSINELVDCSEAAARKICGANAAKFTRDLVDKYANSLTRIYCEDFTRHPEICRNGEGDVGISLSSSWQHIVALMLALFVLLGYQQNLRLTR